MYLQFYGFKEAPFNLTPDSKFLFLSHRHQEALAALLFGVQERKGFICLTGEIGCGKTTLCRAMLSQLDAALFKTCVVLNSYLNDLELLKTINEGFGLPGESDSKKTLLDKLNDFLIEEFSRGHNVVLVIDEAQNLRPETLEQIRMISNLETETAKLIQIIMIGQPELRRTLALPELEQLNQRITVRYHIAPLEEGEIPDYIKHRLAVAESQVEVTFTPQAHKMIYHYSRGIPRRVNVICDRCLLMGYVQGTFNIDDKVVERAVAEVRGDAQDGTALTVGLEGEAAQRRARGLKWLAKLGQGVAYLFVVAFGVWLGIWLYSQRADEQERVRQLAALNKQLAAAAPAVNFPTRDGEVVDVAKKGPRIAAPTPTPVTPAASATGAAIFTPKPTPKPTPLIYQNWEYDRDGVLRVRSAEFCEAASYINVVREWHIDVDLVPFRETTPEEVSRLDMLETVKQLNFEAVEVDTLAEALHLDLPVLVRLEGGKSQLAPYGVITAMRGEVFEVFDPLSGKKMIRRQELEPLVTKAIVLFKDPLGLAGLEPGDEGERVQKLQAWLAKEGLYAGKPDGKYGSLTREAIERLQQQLKIKETGALDRITAAAIAIKLSPQRPRLYS